MNDIACAVAADGGMGARVAAHDWSATAIGAMETWPQTLRSLVGVMLGARQPMFIAWGPERTLIYNDGYASLCGARHPQALGRPFAEVWADIPDEFGSLMDRAFDGEAIHLRDAVFMMPGVDGRRTETHFELSYTPVHGERGEVMGVFGSCSETTQRVLAERENARQLESSRGAVEHLRRMFEQAPGFVALLEGPEHVFSMANAAYYRLAGRRELLGKPLLQALPEARGQIFADLLDEVWRSGRPHSGKAFRALLRRVPHAPPEEVFVDFVLQPLRDDEGRLWGILLQGHDVSEQQRAMAALRDSERRLRLATESVDLGTFDHDLRNDTGWWSPRERALFGFGEHEPITREALVARIHPEDLPRRNRAFARAMRADGDGRYQCEYRVVIGEAIRWLSVNARVYFEPRDGQLVPARLIGMTIDVTERRVAEEALRDADRRKDEFLAVLAHELRNPLAPMRNSLRVLELEPLSGQGRGALQMCDRQLRHLMRLVDDLLEVARIARGKIALRPERVMVGSVIQGVADALAPGFEERRQRLTLRMPPHPVWLFADPVRLAQILENLLTNASKYTGAGGNVDVRLRSDPAEVVIEIADDGIGIDPGDMTRLFEPFSQIAMSIGLAQGGLGVGLALVKRLVTMHGGRIEAASEGRGKGSVFTVRLPRPEAAA